jgi:hypothetical protein
MKPIAKLAASFSFVLFVVEGCMSSAMPTRDLRTPLVQPNYEATWDAEAPAVYAQETAEAGIETIAAEQGWDQTSQPNYAETGASDATAIANDPDILTAIAPSQSGCPKGCSVHRARCDIKGNISFDTGERIYHVPGGEFYDSTVVNPDYGERWFCTEAEAITNGWRKSNW